MEDIIKKAIGAGWCELTPKEDFKTDEGGVRFTTQSGISVYRSNYSALFDPLFWQALGKACGWKGTGIHKMCMCPDSNDREIMEWDMYAMEFYNRNLIDGWDKAVDYLKNLVK